MVSPIRTYTVDGIKFAKFEKALNSPGLRPSGVLDLGYGSFGCFLDPPLPPQWASGAQKCDCQNYSWSPGRSFFDHFFASILDSILDSFWVRFGLVLGSFWPPFGSPNRVKLGTQCILNRHCCENVDFHADLRFPRFFHQNRPQDEAKIALRRPQDGLSSILFSLGFLHRFLDAF